MTLLSPYGNPYLRTPPAVSATEYVSGGGGDGCIDAVVALLVVWARPAPAAPITGEAADFGARGFELAELVARAAAAAGVAPVPPAQAHQLRAACVNAGTVLEDVVTGLATKGALLFDAAGTVGVALGMRRRVITYEPGAGLVVDHDGLAEWTAAALLPGAWGYR
jgi:hypothetical protein